MTLPTDQRAGGMRTPAEERGFLLFYARRLLIEARSRRGQNTHWMLAGAARARREAMAIEITPAQGSLFS